MSNDSTSDDRGLEDASRPDVSALATAVISELHRRTDDRDAKLREKVVRKMLSAVVGESAFTAEHLLEDLMSDGTDDCQIIDFYIPACARELGRLWNEDAIGFAKVTIGTARLQSLLTQIAPPWAEPSNDHSDAPSVLMILQENEAHTLGPHVATAQLRRLGASVQVQFGSNTSRLIDALRHEPYDLILFACSRTDALETISKMVKRVRADVDQAPPIALGGLVLGLSSNIKKVTGVDLVSSDIRVAFKMCERLKQKQKSRRSI